jgi:hypothetical protein
MNVTETASVLAKCAAFDRRTVGDTDVLAWHQAIGDLDVLDALDAVTAHYQQETRWLMPSDVRAHAEAAAKRRAYLKRRRWLTEQGYPPSQGTTAYGPPPSQRRLARTEST